MNIPFHRPNIPNNLDQVLPSSVKSGWLTTGYQVKIFEKMLEEYLGAKYVVGLNSCTAALHLALAAKGFGRSNKFIVPTLTFVSTIECGEYLGMQPILVDTEPDGFLLDLNIVEDILKKDKNVKVIIPVHYAGEPVNMECLWSLADKYGLFILEDAAHALESVANNCKIGNTDYSAAFSFYANKNITTGGEGGALATNNAELAEKVRQLSLHGITRDGWNRYKNNHKWEYDIIELGYKYNLTDYAASFGIWQIGFVKQWQERRKEIVQRYQKGLSEIGSMLLPEICQGHSKHLYVIRLIKEKWSITRNQFIEKMNQKGIGLAVHYKPIHKLSYYINRYNFQENKFPRADSLYNSIISLPLYPSLEDKEIDYILTEINKLYNEYSK